MADEKTKPVYNCGRNGCSQVGKWAPVLCVKVAGQTILEKDITIGIPMYLCDECRNGFEPMSYLSTRAKIKLTMTIALQRKRRINWDTLYVTWRADKDAHRVVNSPDSTVQ